MHPLLGPSGLILRIHVKTQPKVLLPLLCFLLRKGLLEYDVAVLHEEIDLFICEGVESSVAWNSQYKASTRTCQPLIFLLHIGVRDRELNLGVCGSDPKRWTSYLQGCITYTQAVKARTGVSCASRVLYVKEAAIPLRYHVQELFSYQVSMAVGVADRFCPSVRPSQFSRDSLVEEAWAGEQH